jgi:hypothetical protein
MFSQNKVRDQIQKKLSNLFINLRVQSDGAL